MSHYSLVVFGSDVSDKLAPYSENDNDYFTDQNVTDDVLVGISNHHEVDIKSLEFEEQLEKILEWADYVVITKSEFEEDGHPETSYILVNDEKTEIIAIYDYFNHNSKWDWYTEGGRWSKFFKVKEGVSEDDYEVNISMNGERDDSFVMGYADSIRKKDIDFEFMRKNFIDEYLPVYDKYKELTKGMPEYKTIEMIMSENKSLSREEILNLHEEQEVVKMIFNLENENLLKKYVNRTFRFNLEEFTLSRDGFQKYKGVSAYTPNSYIDLEGVFHSKEGMCEEDHKKQFQEYLDSVPDDTWMTIVDCHI